MALAGPALAQGEGAAGEQPGDAVASDQPGSQPPADSIQSALRPAGDPGGLRGTLAARGIAYSLTYIGEGLGNVSGGQRRGATYAGRLDGQLDIDLGRLAGWGGATVHTNVYQIHGRGLSRDHLGNLLAVSGIEALPSTRLYELWLEQRLFDGRLSVRAGQLAADTEFVVSQYAALFMNSTFGFPGLLAADLPNGGPAYPLATPGMRARFAPDESWSASVGLFNGAPAGPRSADPQRDNPDGLAFRTRDPALVMAELACSYDAGIAGAALPGTAKLGAWGHLARFDHQRLAEPGPGAAAPLLADPTSSGIGRRLPGNVGGYLVVDQLLYRPPGSEDGGLGMFARLLGAPGDRNLVGFYADAGLTYKGLLPGRPDDTVGVSFAYARVSDAARAFDADLGVFAPGAFRPQRRSEAVLEATYQAQIVPGWTVQPDFQYIRRPGAGMADPRSPTGAAVKDAAVFGLRSSIRY
nr:carbohydrate porin [Enterovirga sp. DB1703]